MPSQPISSELSASVIHELKQAISAVTILAEITADDLAEPISEDRRQKMLSNLKQMIAKAQHCSRIIPKVQQEPDTMQIDRPRADINDLIMDVIGDTPFLNDDELHINTNFQHNIPPIQANPTTVRQVLRTILRNAVDAMANSSSKKLSVRSRQADQGIYITISDTGCGNPQEHIDTTGTPGFSTNGKDQVEKELASLRQIIRSRGGRMMVNSALNVGTVVRIYWPIQNDARHTNGSSNVPDHP